MMKVRVIFLSIIFLTTGLYVGALFWERQQHTPAVPEGGTPQVGGSFVLKDHRGMPRTEKDLLGKYAIVYFGYTYCPDICPMGLHSLSDALLALKEKAARIQPVFITVDPKRDSEKVLTAFLKQFHPAFWGLTGAEEAIEKAKKAYRIYAAKETNAGKENPYYTVNHSSVFYVMDPEGKLVGYFTHATPAAEMKEKLLLWVK